MIFHLKHFDKNGTAGLQLVRVEIYDPKARLLTDDIKAGLADKRS